MDGAKCCRAHQSLGCLSLHFIKSYFFNAGCLCCSHYYDVEKPPKQARQDTGTGKKLEIESLQKHLNSIEVAKLDKIILMLEEMKKNNIKL